MLSSRRAPQAVRGYRAFLTVCVDVDDNLSKFVGALKMTLTRCRHHVSGLPEKRLVVLARFLHPKPVQSAFS